MLTNTWCANSIYYQHDPQRLSTCPLTIHALLHIADSILASGPVWTAWAFPMERYCGALQPAIRSRRFPYSSLNRYVVDRARLTQIKLRYNLEDTLNFKPKRKEAGQVVPKCKWPSSDIATTCSIPSLILLSHRIR